MNMEREKRDLVTRFIEAILDKDVSVVEELFSSETKVQWANMSPEDREDEFDVETDSLGEAVIQHAWEEIGHMIDDSSREELLTFLVNMELRNVEEESFEENFRIEDGALKLYADLEE